MTMPSNNTSPVFFYTYVLRSRKDNEHYIGYTGDLRRRLEEHRKSHSFTTSYRLPMDLVYYEACLHQDDAKQRERYLKTTAGRRYLSKRLIRYRYQVAWHSVK